MKEYLTKFGVEIIFLGLAVALSAVLGMVLSGKALYRVVGYVHIFLDPSSKGIVFDPPAEKLPLSHNFVSFHLIANFTPFPRRDYQNLFQTDSGNNGIRLEVSSRCDVKLIANSFEEPKWIPFRLSFSRGFERLIADSSGRPIEIPLPQCEFYHPYKLIVTYNENELFRGVVNGETLKEYQIPKPNAQFRTFQFKNGIDGDRPFFGEVLAFDLKAKLFNYEKVIVLVNALISVLCLAGIWYIFVRLFRKHFYVARGTELLSQKKGGGV